VVARLESTATVLQVDLKLMRPISADRASLLQGALRPLGQQLIVGSQAHWNLRKLDEVPVAFDPTLQWCYSSTVSVGLPRMRGVHGMWDDSIIAGSRHFSAAEYVEQRIVDLRGLLPSAVEWMVDIPTIRHVGALGVRLGVRLAEDGCALAAWTLHADDSDLEKATRGLFKEGVSTIISDAPEAVAAAAVGRL
jgi:hypothetical protein